MKLKMCALACCITAVTYPKKVKKDHMVFNHNIMKLCKENTFFRKEVVTGAHSQIVLMSIPVGGDIGEEVHTVDQTLVFVSGRGKALIKNIESDVYPDHLVFVPAGTKHNFKNTGSEELKLFTIYAPAEHKPGMLQKLKNAQEE